MKLETQFKKTLKEIGLKKNEKILVALSGGKDSATTAYFLKKFGYKIEGLHINLGMGKYSERCMNAVKKLCENLDIKMHVYDMKKEMGSSMCYFHSSIQSEKNLKNCAICGVIKKWILNREARKLKFKKIATGHNLDDEVQTFFLNILKGSPELSLNTGQITKNIPDKKFVPRIKPLFYIAESEIRKNSKKNKLPVVYEKCPCAVDSYRIQVRKFTNKLSEKNKKNVIKNFEIVSGKMRRKKTKTRYCEICGEPSRKEICKKCELVKV
jgi:uncharacterized protein (TIGR00269 family)